MGFILVYALLFLLVPLGLFALFGYLVVFHLKRYGLEGSYNQKAALVFSFGLIALSVMVVQRFCLVDWDRINPQQFMQESSKKFFHDYER